MGDSLIGTFGVVLASIFWGSNFVVCRGYDLPPDGMHFVLLMSTGILLIGILTLFSSASEDGDFEVVFSPDGLAGGCIWAIGNFLTVPILRNAGLGIGFSIWSGVNLIVAFIVGITGFGKILPGERLSDPIYGVIGIILAIIALSLFANVKISLDGSNNIDYDEVVHEDDGLLRINDEVSTSMENFQDENKMKGQNSNEVDPLGNNDDPSLLRDENHDPLIENLQSDIAGKRNISAGIIMAILAGILYGFQFVPLSIWNNKVEKAGHIFDQTLPSETIRALRFFFSQFAGIFLTSTAGFFAYTIWRKNKPLLVPSEALLPSILSGMLWSIGCAGGMLATSGLGNAVGFPLVLNGAFLVNSGWSIFYFKEICGTRNLRLFGAALILSMLSSIFISISKGLAS